MALRLSYPWHVESPQTRDRTCVTCIGRQILILCTTRKVQFQFFLAMNLHDFPNFRKQSGWGLFYMGASLVAQRLKHLPAMWETWVRSLGWEDPLEKEMATHSSILAWRIPWTEELDGLQSTGRKESDTTEQLHFHFHFQTIKNLPAM